MLGLSRNPHALAGNGFWFDYGVYAIVRRGSPRIQIDPYSPIDCSPSFAQVRPNCCQTAVSSQCPTSLARRTYVTLGQFVILGIEVAVLASAIVVRLLLYRLIRRAIIAYWAATLTDWCIM
jgi:hypothetical protein